MSMNFWTSLVSCRGSCPCPCFSFSATTSTTICFMISPVWLLLLVLLVARLQIWCKWTFWGIASANSGCRSSVSSKTIQAGWSRICCLSGFVWFCVELCRQLGNPKSWGASCEEMQRELMDFSATMQGKKYVWHHLLEVLMSIIKPAREARWER